MNRAQLILDRGDEPNTALRGGSSGTVPAAAPILSGELAGTIQPVGINVPNIFIPAQITKS